MRGNIAAYIPTLNSGPFQTLNSTDAVMAEVMPVHVQEQPEPTLEEKLAAEYERGRKAGEASATERLEARLAEERQAHDAEVAALRETLLSDQAALLGEGMKAAFDDLENRIAACVADVLEPLIEQQIACRIVASFRDTLSRFLEGDQGMLVRVSGPEALLDLLRADPGGLEGRIEYQPAAAAELTTVIGETTLNTRFAEWMAQLRLAMEAE
ncbi:hypothetical protein [Roseibium aggregatum]|uniref:Flagellar assembly protein FliH n=1 Tax=Roseibium aggregatum TaxID=187304 RepID=A0A926NXY9_9HYPH|nr:hypothetical protein [Roseibium aggregatum]MBD1545690.1 hypothetical protein [Roseibium aggregatum]